MRRDPGLAGLGFAVSAASSATGSDISYDRRGDEDAWPLLAVVAAVEQIALMLSRFLANSSWLGLSGSETSWRSTAIREGTGSSTP